MKKICYNIFKERKMSYIDYLHEKLEEKMATLSDDEKAIVDEADKRRAAESNKYRLYHQLFRNVIREYKKLNGEFTRIKNTYPMMYKLFNDDYLWKNNEDLINLRLPSICDNVVNKITGLQGVIYDWSHHERPLLNQAIEWLDDPDDIKKVKLFRSRFDSFVEDVLKPLVEIHYPAYEQCRKNIGTEFTKKRNVEDTVFVQVLREEIETPEMREFMRDCVIEKNTPTLDQAQYPELPVQDYILQNERLDVFREFVEAYSKGGAHYDFSHQFDADLVTEVKGKVEELKAEGAKEPDPPELVW